MILSSTLSPWLEFLLTPSCGFWCRWFSTASQLASRLSAADVTPLHWNINQQQWIKTPKQIKWISLYFSLTFFSPVVCGRSGCICSLLRCMSRSPRNPSSVEARPWAAGPAAAAPAEEAAAAPRLLNARRRHHHWRQSLRWPVAFVASVRFLPTGLQNQKRNIPCQLHIC